MTYSSGIISSSETYNVGGCVFCCSGFKCFGNSSVTRMAAPDAFQSTVRVNWCERVSRVHLPY